MNNCMHYKDYVGSVEFSEDDNVFFGKVMGISALISYEGTTVQELTEDFHEAVDDYLAFCADKGQEPEKAYKGNFNVRVSPQTHRAAAMYAAEHKMSLNKCVEKAIDYFVAAQAG